MKGRSLLEESAYLPSGGPIKLVLAGIFFLIWKRADWKLDNKTLIINLDSGSLYFSSETEK